MADIREMYHAVLLLDYQKDLHCFVWRDSPKEPLIEYHIKRLTFGVLALLLVANMEVQQNGLDNTKEYPHMSKAVLESFYGGKELTRADTTENAVQLQIQLQCLFNVARFMLSKWISNMPTILEHISTLLRTKELCCKLEEVNNFVKILGIEWNAELDSFFPMIAANLIPSRGLTKQTLTSDIAGMDSILGRCSPIVIKLKILG